MSISDQAFIRAYQEDAISAGVAPAAAIDVGLGSVIPPPHAKFPPSESGVKQAAIVRGASVGTSVASSGSKGDSAGTTTVQPIEPRKPHLGWGDSPKVALSSLSGLMKTAAPAAIQLRPALEVDAVHWPHACESLLARYGDRFDRLAVELRREADSGNKITAITGVRRGEGRTTLALCLARRLGAGGVKTVVIDADFTNPSVAAQLKIAVDRGWESVLDGTETLWDVMIESVADQFSIVPLAATAGHYEAPPAFRIASILSDLADQYEAVVVDAGSIHAESVTSQWLLEPDNNVHNIILAHDVRHTAAHQLAAGCVQLAEAKVRQLGIAETFVVEK